MNSEKYISEKINLTTLTPIFIGDDQGSDLSHLTDFIADGNSVKIIDQNKFENLLGKDPELINEFVSQIKNNSRNFNLEEFIGSKLNSDKSDVTKYSVEVEGYLGNNAIKKFISSLGKPFIPGGTIKGAIRTAIFYNYLINSHAGKIIISSLFKKAADKYPKLNEIDKSRFERKLFTQEINKIYNELYLFKANRGHDFRHIQISDSPLLENSDTKIADILVEYLIKASNKTNSWKQVLKEQLTTTFQFKIEKDFEDDFLKPINSLTHQGIFKIINTFSKDVIEFELERFDEFIRNGKADKKQIEEKLDGIREFYKDLLEKIEKSEDRFAIIRIGGGKTYFDNSIGLALFKADKEKFKQFRKLLGFWKHKNKQFVEEESPITRSFIFYADSNKNMPLGWVVIYLDENKNLIDDLFAMAKKVLKEKPSIIKQNDDPSGLDLSKLANLGKVTYENKNK